MILNALKHIYLIYYIIIINEDFIYDVYLFVIQILSSLLLIFKTDLIITLIGLKAQNDSEKTALPISSFELLKTALLVIGIYMFVMNFSSLIIQSFTIFRDLIKDQTIHHQLNYNINYLVFSEVLINIILAVFVIKYHHSIAKLFVK